MTDPAALHALVHAPQPGLDNVFARDERHFWNWSMACRPADPPAQR